MRKVNLLAERIKRGEVYTGDLLNIPHITDARAIVAQQNAVEFNGILHAVSGEVKRCYYGGAANYGWVVGMTD